MWTVGPFSMPFTTCKTQNSLTCCKTSTAKGYCTGTTQWYHWNAVEISFHTPKQISNYKCYETENKNSICSNHIEHSVFGCVEGRGWGGALQQIPTIVNFISEPWSIHTLSKLSCLLSTSRFPVNTLANSNSSLARKQVQDVTHALINRTKNLNTLF